MDSLPTEIKEVIIYFCDGETLLNLRQLNRHWKILVDQEVKRRNLFKRCLKNEINKDILKDLVVKMYPKKTFLYSNPCFYKTVYLASLKWKKFKNNDYCRVKKFPYKFNDVIDLKISGYTILLGDKRGLYVMNSLNNSSIFYKLGRVKNIELYCTYSIAENKNYEYDKADIMTENNVHHFYDLQKKTFNKAKSYFEKKYMKYWNKRSIEFDMNESQRDPIIKADLYENFVMKVTEKHVLRSEVSYVSRPEKTPFNCQGGRAWFLWHSKLIICSKDDSLNIFADGETRKINYYDFPPISAIFYYAGWLFLGSRYGLLYGYQINFKDILFLDLQKHQVKVKICDTPIVKIDVVEKKISVLVVASDEELFMLSNTKELNNVNNVM